MRDNGERARGHRKLFNAAELSATTTSTLLWGVIQVAAIYSCL